METADKQWVIDQAIEKDLPIPDSLANPPQIKFGLEIYWNAFLNLNCDRASSFDVGPIPTVAILSYASYYDIDDVESFLEVIRRMDNAFIEHHTKKNKRDADRAAKKAKK